MKVVKKFSWKTKRRLEKPDSLARKYAAKSLYALIAKIHDKDVAGYYLWNETCHPFDFPTWRQLARGIRYCAGEFEPPNRDITHWQPLPAPPSGEQAAAAECGYTEGCGCDRDDCQNCGYWKQREAARNG